VLASATNQQRVKGLPYTRFGGQVRTIPQQRARFSWTGCRLTRSNIVSEAGQNASLPGNGRRSRYPSQRERGGVVKAVRTVCNSILIAFLVLATTALWAESKGSLGLNAETNVGGKMLKSGNYTVRWDGTGDQVDLKIYQGKAMVVSIPAHVIQLNTRAPSDSALVNTDGATRSLSQIRFQGKKYALEINSEADGASSSAGASK
jgi:hypothetical protein